MSPLLALPGKENIGLGRHWHGLGVILWMLNGLVYVMTLFATGLWSRIIPTSWDVFPQAWKSMKIYAGKAPELPAAVRSSRPLVTSNPGR